MQLSLIDNWLRKAFTLASMRLAWLASFATTYFATYPDQWMELMARLPWWAPIVIGMATMLSTGGTRLVTFGHKAV